MGQPERQRCQNGLPHAIVESLSIQLIAKANAAVSLLYYTNGERSCSHRGAGP